MGEGPDGVKDGYGERARVSHELHASTWRVWPRTLESGGARARKSTELSLHVDALRHVAYT